jgi:hypothetical protein
MIISIRLFIAYTFSVIKYVHIKVCNSGNHTVLYFAQNMHYEETEYNICMRLLTYLIKYFYLCVYMYILFISLFL